MMGMIVLAYGLILPLHKSWLRNKADIALSKGLALFATEWGTTDASGNGAVDKTSTDEWLTYLEKNGISWCKLFFI